MKLQSKETQASMVALRFALVALQLLLVISVVSLVAARPASAQTTWNLTWSDEFNGPAGSEPSTNDWNWKDKGSTSNGELEVYCAPTDNVAPCSTATPNTFEDGNGNLVVRAMKNSAGQWTSGRMNTSNHHMPQYGRIEASMKLTVGNGLWPAFWMLGSDILTGTAWPTCGEIDIMEWVPQFTATTTSATEHGPGYSGCCGSANPHFTFPNGGTVNGAFHSYGLTWQQNSFSFYRDDWTKPFFTVTSADIGAHTWVFNQPFYIITNEAVGGNFPSPGPDSTTPNPADVLLDYVRVYTAGTSGPPAAPTGVTAAGGNTQVTVSWTASTGATSYNVLRSTTSGGPYTAVTPSGGVTTTSFTDTGLTNGTTYFYVVTAQNSIGTSSDSAQVSAVPNPTPAVQINSGGPAVSPFVADKDFAGGATINHANTIDLSGVTNPAPMAVYQTARIANFTYTIPGFNAGSSHLVRLHFAETYFSTAGSRKFNVSINGTQVLAAFDIFATTGAKNKAVIEQFTENANSSGQYVIQFTSTVNNSLVSGIEIQ